MAADVAGEDDDGVFEVHSAALTIGETSVIEELEEDVEYVGVGFFDFVEQDDAVWASADDFGELTTFFVPNISRGGTDEASDGVFLAVFGHIDAHHGAFVIEQEFGESFGGFGFADTGWAKEQE